MLSIFLPFSTSPAFLFPSIYLFKCSFSPCLIVPWRRRCFLFPLIPCQHALQNHIYPSVLALSRCSVLSLSVLSATVSPMDPKLTYQQVRRRDILGYWLTRFTIFYTCLFFHYIHLLFSLYASLFIYLIIFPTMLVFLHQQVVAPLLPALTTTMCS